MATIAQTPDQSADMLQKLTLDSQPKGSEIHEAKKASVYQYGGVGLHGQVSSFDRSLIPLLTSDVTDPSVLLCSKCLPAALYYAWISITDSANKVFSISV
ncbi:unnamed protein product [Eruca vesicaria subsp. sativa]|uniref:Uncharacterized protein n=1 Tax=Eruca vesicaria subsp. sativa TaxID=29727 RepID=A0ABC8LS58_ERUVS|nr:unnamed protein product [Eruca vesicaria subsp. sativa]